MNNQKTNEWINEKKVSGYTRSSKYRG